MRVISPLIAGTVTVVLAFRLSIRARQQRVAELRRFEIIGEMNHHIRNAMQVMSYQAYASDPKAQTRMHDAINRIDWALREVLPNIHTSEEQQVNHV